MYIVAYFMKNLGFLRKQGTAALVAAMSLSTTPGLASDEVRLPTASEMLDIKADYEKTFGINLKHVHIFYDEPRLSNKGPVGAIRTQKLNACSLIINSRDWKVFSALSFLKGAPNQEVARQFLVAHELSHCLFTREDSMNNLTEIGLDIRDQVHSQETIADLLGAVFVIKKGADPEQTLAWLRDKRSGHVFSSQYNTAKYLNAEILQKIDERMSDKNSTFTFFSESRLFNLTGKPAITETYGLDRAGGTGPTEIPGEIVTPHKSVGLSM